MNNTILNQYSKFVEKVTSKESNYYNDMNNKVEKLNEKVNMSLLITGGLGLSSETGEFNEILKKIMFQGKPLNDDNIFHMKRELGDILWYWVNTCRALNLNPNEVLQENIKKLESRYPGGQFDMNLSENRKEGDL
jgi:NTP pyrophosphatase (non-canonical NTP hydrolase)